MPVRSLKQGSFFDPRVAAPSCLVVGSVPWLLAHWRDVLCPPWLVAGWRGSGRMGRCAWPAPVLMTLLILRWVEEGTSRVGSMRRAKSDIVWRAAMGLESGGPTPSERTMRDFEAFLRERAPASDLPRYLLLHEHIVHLARWSGSAADPTWAMDSTPQHCYGAVLDTVRLLGDGLRLVAKAYSSATRTPLPQLARRWKLPLLLAKSTKGHLSIDWRDSEARTKVITELAAYVMQVVELVRADLPGMKAGPWKRNLVSRCIRTYGKKVEDPTTEAKLHRGGRPRKTGRVLDLHPHEQELRAAREAWKATDVGREYRERTQCERLISQVIRHGGRQARAWGQDAANLQVHAVVMRCNLERFARNPAHQLGELNRRHAA